MIEALGVKRNATVGLGVGALAYVVRIFELLGRLQRVVSTRLSGLKAGFSC